MVIQLLMTLGVLSAVVFRGAGIDFMIQFYLPTLLGVLYVLAFRAGTNFGIHGLNMVVALFGSLNLAILRLGWCSCNSCRSKRSFGAGVLVRALGALPFLAVASSIGLFTKWSFLSDSLPPTYVVVSPLASFVTVAGVVGHAWLTGHDLTMRVQS